MVILIYLWAQQTHREKLNSATYNNFNKTSKLLYLLYPSVILFKLFFLFRDLNYNEFHTMTQGQKMKFLTMTKKISGNAIRILDKINDAVHDEDFENSSS